MTIFVMRAVYLEQAFKEPAFRARWDKCRTVAEFQTLYEEWCKSKGLEIVKVKPIDEKT